ncbi:hypothetical protein [Caulobacter sp. NIBR1757]|uniref:hypothetical protein n=1 Tax=Caulobacter sp. NIBR1757 TaxID=3016000 RepID=UPI0022EFF0E7|nr:hypothetical protein [Caulobacter sp. NIBR1757]WGM37897.1 hypothetical protein AMEJIAPC_00798 [Caulobacter sp. NIBR1757]
MKPLALALGAATVAAFAAIVGLAVYSETLQFLPSLLYDADLITKMATFLLLAVLGLAALLPNRSGQASGFLSIMAMLAIGFGLLATLYDASHIARAVAETGTNDLKVLGPSLAEALMPLTVGLLAGFVATARAGKRPAAD